MAEYLVNDPTRGQLRIQLDEAPQGEDATRSALFDKIQAGAFDVVKAPTYTKPSSPGGPPSSPAPPSWGQRMSDAYSAVAQPVTNAVGSALSLSSRLIGDPLGWAATQAGIVSPDANAAASQAARDRASAAAQFVVPQTPTEAGIAAATSLVGGPLANKIGGAVLSKAGTGLVGRMLAGGAAAATRVGAAAAGGEVGGELSGQDTGEGALEGFGAGLVGEGLGAFLNRIYKAGSLGAVKRVQAYDANNVGQTLEQIPELGRVIVNPAGSPGMTNNVTHDTTAPIFGSVRSPEDLRNLAEAGRGRRMLGDAYGQVLDQIGQIIDPEKVRFRSPADLAKGGGASAAESDAVAAAKDAVRKGLGLRAGEDPPGGWAMYLQAEGAPAASEGAGTRRITFDAARKELATLREKAWGSPKQANPLTATAAGYDPKLAYRAATDQMMQDLFKADPNGVAAGLFDAARSQYRVGVNLLDALMPAVTGRTEANRIVFDTPRLQAALKADEAQLRQTLGSDNFDRLALAARAQYRAPVTPSTPTGMQTGAVDQPASRVGYLPWPLNYPTRAINLMQTPNYAGTADQLRGLPFQLPAAARTGLALGGQRVSAAADRATDTKNILPMLGLAALPLAYDKAKRMTHGLFGHLGGQ